MPVKKKQTLTDKSVKQSINIKIGDVRPKTKRVVRKRKPKIPIQVQPEVKTIFQTALTRDFNVYTDEINKRNEAIKASSKLSSPPASTPPTPPAPTPPIITTPPSPPTTPPITKKSKGKKSKIKTAIPIVTAVPVVEGIVYDYKKNSVFNPEGLEPKSTTMSKEVVINKPLYSTERKPQEPIYDYKKYSTPAGAFIPQSTQISKVSTEPEPFIEEEDEEEDEDEEEEGVKKGNKRGPKGLSPQEKAERKRQKEELKIMKAEDKERRGRPKTDERTKFEKGINKKINDKLEIIARVEETIKSGNLVGKPLENAKNKVIKLNNEVNQLKEILKSV